MATNDLFATPEIVEILTNGGTYTSDVISNVGYTSEDLDPFYPDSTSIGAPQDGWWSYYPDNGGSTTFELRADTPAGGNCFLYLYSGNTKDSLTQLAFDSGNGNPGTCQVVYTVVANTPYMLRASYAGDDTYQLIVTGRKTPVNRMLPAYATAKTLATITAANDNFIDATQVEILDEDTPFVSTMHFASELSAEEDEPNNPYLTAWWWYVPAESGSVTIDTEGSERTAESEIFPTIAVYRGGAGHDFAALQELVWANQNVSDDEASVTLDVVAGTQYFIQLDSTTYDDAELVLRVTGPVSEDPTLIPPAECLIDTPPPVSVSNDVLRYADELRITRESGSGATTGTFTSDPVPNLYYDVEAGESFTGDRSAWWVYTPLVTGTAFFDTRSSTTVKGYLNGPDVNVHVFTGGPEMDDLVQEEYFDYYELEDPPGTWTFWNAGAGEMTVTANTTYYVRLSDGGGGSYSGALSYILEVEGPPTDDIVSVSVPVAGLVAESPIVSTVEMLLTPLNPETGFPAPVTPVTTPVYQVLLQTTGPVPLGVEVELEIRVEDVANEFVVVYTLSPDPFELSSSSMIVTVPSEDPLDPGLYVWQARLTYLGHTFDWVPAITMSFEVEEQEEYDTDITWTVGSGIAPLHLWFIEPPRAVHGEQVTLYGHGMTNTPGTVTVAGESATVNSWTKITATGATTERTIDPQTPVVDPEHYEIVVTVPTAAEAPGGPVEVNT